MIARRRLVSVTLLLVAALVAAGCGQKAGVHVASGGTAGAVSAGDQTLAGGGASGGTGEQTPAGGGAADAGGGATAAGGASGGGASGAGSGGATAGGAASGSGAAAGGSSAGASGGATAAGSTVGVSDTEIRIGIHAPATGAGAPAPSFDKGKDIYFQYLGAGINGRRVKVFFEDDKYNPSSAVAACKKLVEQDKVFLLLGGGGADQIAACAKYAASVGVPYLAEGVGEAGLGGLGSYFAVSLTYKQQGPLLAQYIKNVVKKTKVAMVRANTANFEDGHQGFLQGVQQQGLEMVKDITIPKDASASEVQSAAVQLCGDPTKRPEVVFPLMSPAIFLQFASAVRAQNCIVRWAGVGVTIGLNVVAQIACSAQSIPGGASFFSPFPGIDQANAIDPAYNATYRKVNGSDGDDIGFALWGAEKLLGEMLKAAGRSLTRQGFIAAVNGKKFSTHVYPDVDFSKSRFGGTGVHVLKADCSKQQYVTEFTFKSAF